MDEITRLKNENANLTKIVETMDKNAILLVRRDLELRRANSQLITLDTQKSEFISIAAHQIRTPLSALRWSQQMLLDGDLGEITSPQRDLINQAQQSVVRLVNLVNNLLEVEHLELQNEKKDFVIINLNLLIKECCEEFTATAVERRVTLSVNLSQTPALILAKPESVKDVFLNIIDNAMKYTLIGGSVTINVSLADTIEVTIADTGIGIPVNHQENVFKRFSRAENAKKLDADGSGLGLYIVKKIMESIDGTVSYTSTEGVGTTFKLLFMQFKQNQ